MVVRFSSRQRRLDQSFLNERLRKAESYDRIAGYFRSSVFEIAGEAFEAIPGQVRIVCNTGLDERDVRTAAGQKQEFFAGASVREARFERARYERLAELLHSQKVQIRVLADHHFGLIHGKAGVVRFPDGSRTCFIGSINETREAWCQHYELLWEDDDPEAVNWVQEEFDALWNHAGAQPLANAVIAEVDHLLRRKVIPIEHWNPGEAPSAPFRETTVNREGPGLMAHQKYFVGAVARELKTFGQARFLLADEVGLGKTIQLAMAAELSALMTRKPALILCPKNLVTQWQDEMSRMLGIPSARWDGQHRLWITEAGVEYPNGIGQCPRLIGIVSSSLITAQVEYIQELRHVTYACVVVDEAHRARVSRPLGRQGEPNLLFQFTKELASRTDSLLLGTATPVQLHREELYDLFVLLHTGCERVLGTVGGAWRRPDEALDAVSGHYVTPRSAAEAWRWFSNPLPPEWEPDRSRTIRRIWEALDDSAADRRFERNNWYAQPGTVDRFDRPLQARLVDDFPGLIEQHNPFIRHTIKRTRELVKQANEPRVVTDDEAVEMTGSMEEAYALASQFCKRIAKRKPGGGILKTLLLRRIGSSLAAGLATANKILRGDRSAAEEEDEEATAGWDLDTTEEDLLRQAIAAMQAAGDADPKLLVIMERLRDRQWLRHGCILFSQYFDSVWWLAGQLRVQFPKERIGIYAGGIKCYLLLGSEDKTATRDELKQMVEERRLRLMIATDAASEGLNLQKLETLINLDLPWNPARLEQRKGRINRIGQAAEVVRLLNLRYHGSVEDNVHQALSERLKEIHGIFGTLPDMLEDLWVTAALEDIEAARIKLDDKPKQHPFQIRYNSQQETFGWDECELVLKASKVTEALMQAW